ncbi:wsc domain-containing protein [Rutstroemia sp. NJR-2017a BVV2]|nr:wsc domain-containing protein [Rutstroemia sp. NJR-2017a BVV2]
MAQLWKAYNPGHNVRLFQVLFFQLFASHRHIEKLQRISGIMLFSILLILLPFFQAFVNALGPTDEIQDADPAQSGYLDNHNMHPATVGSAIFGILWKNNYGNNKEKWYAKPLVYTPPGGSQLVFIASSMNIIRTLDAVNGTLLNSRTIQPPFLQSDLGCTDIPDFIGIVGTPIIDPSTSIVYFFSKGYKNGAYSGGVANGILAQCLLRYFLGGTVLQRPSLTMINGVVIGAFGGHCDLFNYTGMLVGASTTPGVGVTSIYAMESSPGAPPVQTDFNVQQGGKAGIWQGGMGLATDGNRLFLATGNGEGHANGDVPASGRTPLSTLDEVVGNFAVSSSGKISLTDYFEPYEYVSMDAGDRDLGSGGVALLDPTVFFGTGVSRMAIVIGKNGKSYILNANNLGGFKQGSGGFPTMCYKLGHDAQGAPLFTLFGQSQANSAGVVGIGIPTVTTYKGQAGTGILWVSDPNAGLKAYNAVPVNGVLTPISLPPTGGLNKFQRPAFGNGRLYVSDTNGNVICLGSPVALPLQCSQPVDFGQVAIGSTGTQLVNCTAQIAITSINGCTTGDKTWQCLNSTLPQGPLAQGTAFSFPITWNLTQASINDAQNASFGHVLPGVASTSLDIYTTNAVPKYSTIVPVSVSGTTVSKGPFLNIAPAEVDLGGIVVGSQAAYSGLSGTVIVSNIGAQVLNIIGTAWTPNISPDDGSPIYTNITNGSLGNGFSSTDIPKAGDTISSGGSVTVPLNFLSNITGAYSTFVEFWTDGGNRNVFITGSASSAPVANISIATIEGGWDFSSPVLMNFGNVLAGKTVTSYIRICNSGGSALLITKSKPPIDTELLAPNSGVDLHEGQVIAVNTCATGAVSIVAAPLGVNRLDHVVSDVWILNVEQIGPLLSNGSAEYLYLGCYYDGGGRQLLKTINNATNENGGCQTYCFGLGYIFAGTEYRDTTQACGGDGTFLSVYYDRLRYVPGGDSIPGLSSPSSGNSTSSSTGTTSTASAAPTPNSPVIVQSIGQFAFVGCYTEATTGRALSDSTYANDNMTVESCYTFCSAFAWFGVEYRRECYCGNTINAGSVLSTTGNTCTLTCMGNSSEYCGGSSRLQMYHNGTGASSKSATTSSPSPAPSGVTITSAASTFTVSKTLTSTTPSTSGNETGINPSIITSTGPSVSTTATLGFASIGCFSDPGDGPIQGHNLVKFFSNDSMTPELCISSALAQTTAKPPITYNYIGLEYGRECYAGTAPPTPEPSSLTGAHACTMSCKGDPTVSCGGPNMYNLYVTTAVLGSGISAVSTANV